MLLLLSAIVSVSVLAVAMVAISTGPPSCEAAVTRYVPTTSSPASARNRRSRLLLLLWQTSVAAHVLRGAARVLPLKVMS